MPLSEFQAKIARLLAGNRTEDSHLAGGAALHFTPNSKRYSNDLDYFHDSVERVASAFNQDQETLKNNGYTVSIELSQPGYISALIKQGGNVTKIDWAHDSAWRFMPAIKVDDCGFQLHPVDLAINKVLALAGRDEPRDFIDTLHCHRNILSLGALCWGAAGKDPGFTPLSLLELLRRRGKYRPEDFDRLMLTEKVNPLEVKREWLQALSEAEEFIKQCPSEEIGCLFYAKKEGKFIDPTKIAAGGYQLHFGCPGGVIPGFKN